jgi:transcriptional regulator GlxA family with amidase domain
MAYRFNFLIYPEIQPMDVMGPWEVIATWKMLYPNMVDMQLVSEHGGVIPCLNNINLTSHSDFATAKQGDCLVVPGGAGRLQAMNNAVLLDFIREQAKHAQAILSICTGTFLLAKAGLLAHKKATTYWRALPELATYNDIEICEQRVVKDGKFWFSGGISSGIDLAFAYIADCAGVEIAGQVQLAFEYFPDQTCYATRAHAQQLPDYITLKNIDPKRLPAYMAKKING